MKILILMVALIAYVSTASVGSIDESLPKEVDWRKRGAITRVKSEENCASDWAFTTTGLLEGHHFLKTGKLVELSVQNLLDCSTDGNCGCSGGSAFEALQYVIANGGIDTEESYPYTGKYASEICFFNKESIGATAKGYFKLPAHDEEKLKEAVAKVGPLATYLHINGAVQRYKTGVFNDCENEPYLLAHNVLLVGYGTDNETHQDYWIVKNSWGTNWGENGYMRIARNTNDKCGIATAAFYPVV